MSEGKANDFDEMTSFLSDFGPFQIALIFLLSFFVIPVGYMAIVVVFVSDTPEFHCKINPRWTHNRTNVKELMSLEHNSTTGLDSCTEYKVRLNLTEPPLSNATEPCAHGWEFSKDTYTATIVSEWSLVCGDAWKVPFSSSMYFLGVSIGAFTCGNLSDRFGRKPVLFSTMAIQALTALIQAASVNWAMFCVLNCLRGFGQTSCYNASIILGIEILSPKSRITNLLGQNVGFGAGYALLALFGYFIRDWRMLLVACAIPGLLLMPLWWVIPESPRWLLQRNRLKEAEEVIRKAARMNNVPVPEVIFKPNECLGLMRSNHEESSSSTCLDLLRTTNIRIITILGSFIWFSCVTTFYGLSLNMNRLHGNVYLNCFISAAIDISAYIGTCLLVNRVSRPVFLFSSMCSCGVLLLVIPLVPNDMEVALQVLVLSGRVGITSAFAFIFVFFIELMPTVIRNTAIGVFAMSGRIGTMICPYIVYFGVYNKLIPYIVFGTICLTAAAFSVFLPDTRDKMLPDLISQMQTVQCPCCPKENATQQPACTTREEMEKCSPC